MLRRALIVFLLGSTLACGRVDSRPDANANAAAGSSNEPEHTSGAPDPTVTARYRWSECARIQPRSRPWDVRYASDGSVLVLDQRGRLIDYSADGDAPTFLLQANAPTLGEEDLAATSIAMSGDGRALALWNGSKVRVYRAPTQEPLGENAGPLELVTTVDVSSAAAADGQACATPATLSPDGSLLVSSGDADLCLWDIGSGSMTASFGIEVPRPPAYGGLGPVEMNPGFTSGGDALRVLADGYLRTYSTDGEQQSHLDLRLDGDKPRAVSLSPDAEIVLAWNEMVQGSTLRAIDAESGDELWRDELDVAPSALTVSRGGYVLAPGANVYRISDGARVAPAAQLEATDLSPDGQRVLVTDAEWAAERDVSRGRLSRFYGANDSRASDLDLSRDGRFLLSMGLSPLVWQLDSDFAQSRNVAGAPTKDLDWNGAISPDGHTFLLSGTSVTLIQRDDLSELEAELHPNFAGAWRFSPDGAFVAGSTDAEHVGVLDALTLTEVNSFPSAVSSGEAAFSPNGALLATSQLDVFKLADGQHLWGPLSVPGGYSNPGRVEFSPDGSELVALSACDCPPARYDAQSGEQLAVLPLSSTRAHYSPEGHWIVSGGRVVHIPSGAVSDYAADATAAVFTPQGDIIASEEDGSLVLYCRTSE